MASYIVLEPTDAVKLKPAKRIAGDNTIFVRDEFTVFALILPFLWLLAHRLWWHALMVALIGGGAFSVLGSYLSSAFVVSGLSFLLSLFVALEGRNWYLTALRRKGYEEVALISANHLSDAEILYFYGALKPAEKAEPQAETPAKAVLKSTMTGNSVPDASAMIGLVEYHGRS